MNLYIVQNPRRRLLLFDRPDNPALWSRCFIYSGMTGDGLSKQAIAVPRRQAISLAHGNIGTEPQPFPEGFLLGLKRYQIKLGRHAISCKRQRLIGREIEASMASVDPGHLDDRIDKVEAGFDCRSIATRGAPGSVQTWILGIAAHICVHV